MNAYQRYKDDWTARNPTIPPMTPAEYWQANKEARRIEKETEEVIERMKQFYPRIADYNVRDDGADTVELLDKNDKLIQTITSEQLTNFWN